MGLIQGSSRPARPLRALEGVLKALTLGGLMRTSITPRRRSTLFVLAILSMLGSGATLQAIGLGRLEISARFQAGPAMSRAPSSPTRASVPSRFETGMT